LEPRQFRDLGLAKTAGILVFGIPGLQSLVWSLQQVSLTIRWKRRNLGKTCAAFWEIEKFSQKLVGLKGAIGWSNWSGNSTLVPRLTTNGGGLPSNPSNNPSDYKCVKAWKCVCCWPTDKKKKRRLVVLWLSLKTPCNGKGKTPVTSGEPQMLIGGGAPLCPFSLKLTFLSLTLFPFPLFILFSHIFYFLLLFLPSSLSLQVKPPMPAREYRVRCVPLAGPPRPKSHLVYDGFKI